MVNVDGRTDRRTDRWMNKRTETCTPKSPMLKQVRQKVVFKAVSYHSRIKWRSVIGATNISITVCDFQSPSTWSQITILVFCVAESWGIVTLFVHKTIVKHKASSGNGCCCLKTSFYKVQQHPEFTGWTFKFVFHISSVLRKIMFYYY